MKKIIYTFLLLLQTLPVFSQSEEIVDLDSINYYFEILLNNERDSVAFPFFGQD